MQSMRWPGPALASLMFLLASNAPAAEGLGYDPAADPFEQLGQASTQAVAENKLILVIAGGDWCIWCHYLQAYLDRNDDVARALDDTFVVVHVNYGSENRNEAFFATLPEAPGYPHFWVLARDGALLKSQGTAALEDGGESYDRARIVAFIDEWRATLGD
jgi:thiol-disulfide isomerase/thioredoxin